MRTSLKQYRAEYFQSVAKIVPNLDAQFIIITHIFAPIIQRLKEVLEDKLLGVVEDTETGHRQYQQLSTLPFLLFRLQEVC